MIAKKRILLLSVTLLVFQVFCPVTQADFLPDNLTLTVDMGGVNRTLNLNRRSFRTPGFVVRTWQSGTGYSTTPSPEVRSYRGTCTEESNVLVCAQIYPNGTMDLGAFNHEWGKGWYWRAFTVDVSSQLPPASIWLSGGPSNTLSGVNYTPYVADPGTNPSGSGEPVKQSAAPSSSYFPPSGGFAEIEFVMDIINPQWVGMTNERQACMQDITMAVWPRRIRFEFLRHGVGT